MQIEIGINNDEYRINHGWVNCFLKKFWSEKPIESRFVACRGGVLPHDLPQFIDIKGKKKDSRHDLLSFVLVGWHWLVLVDGIGKVHKGCCKFFLLLFELLQESICGFYSAAHGEKEIEIVHSTIHSVFR